MGKLGLFPCPMPDYKDPFDVLHGIYYQVKRGYWINVKEDQLDQKSIGTSFVTNGSGQAAGLVPEPCMDFETM